MAEHRWHASGDEMLRYLAKSYQVRGLVHWPTAISGAGALAGEMALLAHEHKLPRAGRVKSPATIAYIHDGKPSPRCVWGYCALVADEAFSLPADEMPDYEEAVARLLTGPGPESYFYPTITLPATVAPRENPRNAGPRHRRTIHTIAQRHSVGIGESAYAVATAAMKMVGFAHHLGTREMMKLFLETLVAASRAVPLDEPMVDPAFGQVGALLSKGNDADLRPPLPGDDAFDPWGNYADDPEEFSRQSVAAGGFGRRR